MAQFEATGTEVAEVVFEGTWDELVSHADEFSDKRLRLSVLAPVELSESEIARRAKIASIAGKYKHLGVSVEDLHHERAADLAREPQALASFSMPAL